MWLSGSGRTVHQKRGQQPRWLSHHLRARLSPEQDQGREAGSRCTASCSHCESVRWQLFEAVTKRTTGGTWDWSTTSRGSSRGRRWSGSCRWRRSWRSWPSTPAARRTSRASATAGRTQIHRQIPRNGRLRLLVRVADMTCLLMCQISRCSWDPENFHKSTLIPSECQRGGAG